VSGKLSSPRDLFLASLAQMLWVERMLVYEVLPELQRQVESESLAAAVQEHLAQTHGHVARCEEAFRTLGAEPASARHAGAAGLADQHRETTAKLAEPRLADLFHAGAAIATEHLEIAGYDLLIELARALGRDDLERLLDETRREEVETLERLTELARDLRAALP
jgi:ferritin-like metal-binding protein YciE